MTHPGREGTPVKQSSVSFSNDATRKNLTHLGPIVAGEIRGTVFSGFDALSFINSLYPVCETVHVGALIGRTFDSQSGRWQSWPHEPTEQAVTHWLREWTNELVQVFGADNVRSRIRNSGHVPLLNSDAQRKPDVIFIDRNLSLPCPEDGGQPCTAKCDEEAKYCTVRPVSWRCVRIVGELKKNFRESGPERRAHSKMVLTISHRVREIFGTQPGRRYVHAFSLCGSLLRCFLFDRSGVVASEHFNIHSKPELTVRVFHAYLYGSPEWTGFDPTIQVADFNSHHPRTYDPTAQVRGDPFINSFADDGNPTQLYLDPTPLWLSPTIASRGSVCWRARKADSESGNWEFVVKDQWRNEERDHEGILLESLKGIEGVTQMVHYEDVMVAELKDDTVHSIRRGLDFDSQSITEIVLPSNQEVYRLVAESSNSISTPPAQPAFSPYNLRHKRSRPSTDSHRSQTPKRRRNALSEENASNSKAIAPYNRIHGRLVLHNVGRRLKHFQTREELLLALRSAIKGYCNMLNKGIMHRDVSVNNIMISTSTSGYLIDLDFAVLLCRQNASGAPHRTGTPEFMATDVLDGKSHLPRHDLESFFYVLIWIYTNYPVPGVGSPDSPDPNFRSGAHSWGLGSYDDMSRSKRALHDVREMKSYRRWFYEGWSSTPMWQLAVKWWKLFFNPQYPDIERVLMETWSKESNHSLESDVEEAMQLANKMIAALDEAVEALKAEDAGDQKHL
ncbi:hypothetical protein DFH27DRAFT_570996 [Peziza echinospora]|nr:hypothetical protein DFH27DRAFT_570996 [Peziza echinospora]